MARNFIKEICSIDLSKLAEKQRISPINKATGLDGRVFNIDGQAVLQRLQENGLQLVLNVAHEYGGKAAGWFDDFELRENGLYAKLRLTALGTELLESEQYKYLSPEYLVDYDTNTVELIIGVGLVNQPNLLNEALNHLDPEGNTTMTEEDRKKLQAANAAVDNLTSANNALQTENNQLTAKVESQAKAQRLVQIDNAITAGKLKPAKKQYALTLEENALKTYLELEAADTSTIASNNLGGAEGGDDSDMGGDVFNQLGIKGEQ